MIEILIKPFFSYYCFLYSIICCFLIVFPQPLV
eukprot:UN12559